jgi:pilus assembly protein CpaC
VTPEIVAPIPADTATPELKFPEKFLPPNSGIAMHTPDAKTPESMPPAAKSTMPVEKLIESMKPETPLVIESSSGQFGTGSQTTAAPPSAPQ